MENPWMVAVVTVLIIGLSAFFVAVEFALISARRNRLEEQAATSRSARAALRSSGELTLLLAGSQLGITICTLALGAITKPAVHHWLTPLFEAWGVVAWAADAAGFVLALLIVTFLHLVVGEMAPKSWAIAHPETSATVLALPMRAFMWLTRPILRGLNAMANWMLAKVGVEATDEIEAGQNPAALRVLVEHSAEVGSLDATYSAQLTGALELDRLTLADIVRRGRMTAVPVGATVADVQARSLATGHLRILVGDQERIEGMVHVRDTLTALPTDELARWLRPVETLPATMKVYDALAHMRRTSSHLVLVDDGDAHVGVVTLSDLLKGLFPLSDQEPQPA
ncbi:hemolysin family protein [Nocardioides jishulii]|uniref:HlyC/CorC family transporter n=1 Tax=Nocardioides jishulii TaxID=2575440 RepID=A0A4V5TJU2_9ACTN|nr:hemolysin family protein [Nocardioides jishulii]QCX28229.1 HlyC/CorC family transporter [Nocardioides jishulii]TKI60893.1 HlyC/CorC family transporter [Nocardioides jishulii]